MPTMPGALILAAGFSRRFGSNKLVAELPNKRPLILETISNIQQATTNVSVVVQEGDSETKNLLINTDINIISFDNANHGIGASLAYGVQQTADWAGWLVCLADMPHIKPCTYRALLNNISRSNIVLPTYNNRIGNPVGFGSSFYDALIQLSGDTGGKGIVQKNPRAITQCAVDDSAIFFDIDSKEDIQAHHSVSS